MSEYTVHDEPDFAPVYESEGEVTIDKSVLRALLDLATGSMDFGSGFWDNEQTEIARKVATVLGIEPRTVTPGNFKCQYDGHVLFDVSKTHSTNYRTGRCQDCLKIIEEK
ncbi:hypothetical protein [Caudoviricetes sp.]|nr:hypothetical protein [Caudoviricetes sp.]